MIRLKCLVVDDEPFARKGICQFILQTPFLEKAGEAANIRDALPYLSNAKADLLFLDIEMPGKDGISFLQELKYKPNTIIITAHPQFAVKGFDLNVIDYLLKPVTYERFLMAVNKVRPAAIPAPEQPGQYLFVKNGTQHEKILISEIDYLEAKGNYLEIHLQSRSVMTYLSLKKVLDMLPPGQFLKIHKSYIINISKVTRVENHQLWLYNKPIPISRSLKEDVNNKFFRNKIKE